MTDPTPQVDQATNVISAEDHVPFPKKLAYGIAGPVDILSVWILVSIAYPLFNMELQLAPTKVAIILMSLRLWDGVADPIMGWISDNTRTRWGRRRPYIFVGAILAGLTFPFIWWFPQGLGDWQIVGWVIGFGIIFYTCFTIWAMPYQSLLMEMTPDYNERTRVAAVRGVMQSVAGLVVGFCWWLALRPVFADPVTGVASTANGMRYISIVIAGIIMILGILPAIFVKERYYESETVQNQGRVNLFKSMKETLSNKPFIILCAFTIFFLLGTSIYDSYGRYVGTYYVLGGDWERSSVFQIYGTFIYTACSLSLIPVFRRVSEHIGKKKTLFIATGLVLFSGALTWFSNRPDLPYLMLVNTIFIGAGYAGLWLMIPSMQADVIDSDELATGERREGSFAAIYSWVLKLSFCIGFLISGPLLEMTGFKAELGGEQPASVLLNMRIGYFAIPVAALIIAIVLLRAFPITPEYARNIRTQLEARRGKV
ncbi:MFS transporter [Puniceicoccales bacterium CK1056]|uniref:MFS transporter n=1 Tax=Oceanipulchritudo coccoides TaxID=2706888 RepID=A0A6B2M358_9BACT|nr:MFS transporter [Oceanipulchritudo coccoides]NDV63193.1 MFS transporter [Oceanipulchritudo coccoides]